MSFRFPMPKPSRALLTMAVTLVVVLLAGRPAGTAAPRNETTPPFAAASLDAEQKKGQQLVQTLHLEQALGPLAPVALSPFFALTCLSGASLLADSGIPYLDKIQNNVVLGENSPLHNGFVFAGLLALTVITTLPKLTKVTKPLAQAIDQIEAHAGIIAVVAVQFLSTMNLGSDDAPATIVYQAGILTFTNHVIIAVFSAINIFVINTVKFFFEVMIWLSPFPVVDAAFEAANKAVAAFLLGLYLASPWTAMILNLLIFAICLVIFTWVHRRVVYMHGVLGDPILGWIAEKIFRRPPATAISTPLPNAVARHLPDRTLVLKAFAGKSIPGVKRKARGYLVRSGDRLVFAQHRFLRNPIIAELPQPGPRNAVQTGLLSNAANFGDTGQELIITRRYNAVLDSIRLQLGAEPATSAAEAAPGSPRAIAASREIGAAARAGSGRDELRAELA